MTASIEPTNADRARWAKNALAVFTAETYSGDEPDTMNPDDLEAAISDLICDLFHLASKKGMDAQEINNRAITHYGVEFAKEWQTVRIPARPPLLNALFDIKRLAEKCEADPFAH